MKTSRVRHCGSIILKNYRAVLETEEFLGARETFPVVLFTIMSAYSALIAWHHAIFYPGVKSCNFVSVNSMIAILSIVHPGLCRTLQREAIRKQT